MFMFLSEWFKLQYEHSSAAVLHSHAGLIEKWTCHLCDNEIAQFYPNPQWELLAVMSIIKTRYQEDGFKIFLFTYKIKYTD